jgi:hypothetical protein
MEHEPSDLRQERGVQQLAAALTYWLAHNLSQDRMASLIHWAYGETSGFDGGTFSRIKNAKQSRGAGLRHLDALAEANARSGPGRPRASARRSKSSACTPNTA